MTPASTVILLQKPTSSSLLPSGSNGLHIKQWSLGRKFQCTTTDVLQHARSDALPTWNLPWGSMSLVLAARWNQSSWVSVLSRCASVPMSDQVSCIIMRTFCESSCWPAFYPVACMHEASHASLQLAAHCRADQCIKVHLMQAADRSSQCKQLM